MASSCKICTGSSELYGVVDLHRPCEIPGGVRPPPSGVPVYCRRCAACGFVFTDAFDDWSEDQFKTHICNGGYRVIDPDYQTARPNGNASIVANLRAAHKGGMRVLDFGGGNDVFCAALRASGFAEALRHTIDDPRRCRQRVGEVFQRLETSHQIELTLRAAGIFRHLGSYVTGRSVLLDAYAAGRFR